MKQVYGVFATESEKLDAMRYEVMEAGRGRSGDSDEMLRKFWETLESGLQIIALDDDDVRVYDNIFGLIADTPAVSIYIENKPVNDKWIAFISD